MQLTEVKGFNLSIQQKRLWSIQKDSKTYRAQCAFRLEGKLNVVAFLHTFQSLVNNHTILRTTFYCLPGMDIPLQLVSDDVEVECVMIDLENLSEAHQAAQFHACFTFLQQEPFNFEHTPLIRASILRLSMHTHLFLISMPALLADDATLVQCAAALSQAYSNALQGELLTLDSLQYADVSAWQDTVLEENAGHLREYWRKIDLHQLEAMSFSWQQGERGGGFKAEKRQQADFTPHLLPVPLEESLSKKLRSLTHTSNGSIATWLLACWQVTLWHLIEVSDFVIGVACDGRIDEELIDALGLYTRFVPLKARLVEDLPFDQALALTAASQEEALEGQLYFTWEAAHASAQDRSAPRFFPLCFDHVAWPTNFQEAGLTISLEQRYCCVDPFHLKLSVLQVGEHVQLELHYDPAEVTEEQGKRVASVLLCVIKTAIAHPQELIGNFPLLAANEQEHVRHILCGRVAPCPARTLHQLFEEQAERRPTHLAVIDTDEQVSYRELNCRANQLAHLLRRRGVGPNVLVGLCVSRSVSMLIGMLAILKAGGAYVPLDSESPPRRLTYQLQESHASLLLTQQSLLSSLPTWDGQTVCLENIMHEAGQEPETNLETRYEPHDLAYVIYTSGSTGVPKGVMIQQQSVVNYTLAMCSLLEVKPGWHYATVSTLAADLANTVIFCALASGGCLQVLDYATVTSAEAFHRWIERHPIDVLKIVPSHLLALLTGKQARTLLPRRALILGGEALTRNLVQRLQALRGICAVYNHYGPTETTIGVLVNALGVLEETNHTWEAEENVPLGRPIANTEALILNAGQQIVPAGVPGELYLSGMGVALGYLHQPGQTAERFVPHPFSSHAGERLYRTGDLARYTADGQIEFLGRCDSQVKVRGYRIELGEIEAVLRSQTNVRQAVVVLREDMVPEGPQLVGYVTTWNQSAVTAEALRTFVSAYVPEYMVPSTVVILKALPLTANGKVDRHQLPRPERNQPDESALVIAPRGPIEEVLLEIWSNLLAMPSLSIHDNFFQSGGHSLLATQIISRIQLLLQVELPILSLFEAPTIAGFAQRVEQALRAGQALVIPPLLPRERPQHLPLSFAQQRLWFLDQLMPESTAYLIPMVQRLEGLLDVKILEQCLAVVMRRHESLRTTFEERDGQPVQVIHSVAQAAAFSLLLVDLGNLSERERQEVARCLAGQERQRSFDLARGPLLRSWVLRLAPEEHVLLLTLHHIITDGWSSTILQRELRQLYQAVVAGQPSPLKPLPVQYADYALWQRDWLRGEVLEAQLDYWKGQLAGLTPLELPSDHPRPPVQSGRGASQSLLVPPPLQQELMSLSQREGVTLFMTLLAAFQVLLARYSGQQDISVGTPIANRRHAEVEGLIGFFVNTLVLRSDLSGQPSFVELLGRVRQVALGAYAHQDVPFEMLVEQLEPERDLIRSPLFQVMFSLQQALEMAEKLEEIVLSSLEVESSTTKFDLALTVTSRAQGLVCHLNYNTDLFEASTIQRLLEHWQVLLQGIVSQPQQPIGLLPLLTEAQESQLLHEWNATHVAYPRDLCLHQLFERQVEQSPEAVALVFEEQQLTYHELNARANQLAHYLQHLGVGPEVLVGLCLERSLEMVIALYAILKAGGAYVPLDPDYPEARLALLVDDMQLSVIVTQQRFIEKFALPQTTLLGLDTNEWLAQRHRYPSSQPVCMASAHNLAYVIHTSGSTGKPKGAMNTHRGIVNRLLWMQVSYHLTPVDRVLQKTPFNFDVSVWEFFWPLFTGATLIVSQPGGHRDSGYLVQLVREQDISTLHFVPSMLSIFLEEAGLEQCQSIRQVICSGEALTVDYRVRFFSRFQHAQLHNLYGPTEAAVDVTSWTCEPMEQRTTVPIGRPIANLQVYVLDGSLQPVPIGVAGELYIGGVGVGRGYLGRPDQTAEKFLPHPFSSQPGARLYRTGDLVRYGGDGSLEFLGRRDQQVKLRGYRIELGEIEVVLSQHPAVREAVVLAREDHPGDKRLVGYVVPQSGQGSTLSDLQPFLQARLPAYMVPQSIVLLQALPVTANGKLDRAALPGPAVSEEETDGVLVGPRSPIEDLLSEIWSQVLARPPQGIHEHFFEAGGHSLLAAQLISRVRKLLGVDVPLRALFEAPTIAGLAQRVEQNLRSEQESELPRLSSESRTQDLPLSFAQQRLWFLDQLEPRSVAYLMPMVLRLHGSLDPLALEWSLGEMTARHEILRTSFRFHNGQPVQVIAPVQVYRLLRIDLRAFSQAEREKEAWRLAEQEVQQPFDLAQGSLLRTRLLQLDEQDHVLLLTMHHIISDAWSMGLFTRELSSLYTAFMTHKPSSLPALPIQYADFALWQRRWLQGEVLDSQLRYWTDQLTGIAPLNLPTDHPRPAVQTFRGARQSILLPASLRDELKALSQREGVTLFMTLTAAFQVLLARYSGQRDIAVGTPIANRHHAEIEGLIGFFVNTLVLRTRLADDHSFQQVLAQVREVCLGAYAHQDVPFEKLVEVLQPERDLSRSPLFQVMIGLQHAVQSTSPSALSSQGLTMSSVPQQGITTKFDLLLTMTDYTQGLNCVIEYSTDLFEADTITRMLGHWQTLLEGVVHTPHAHLSDLPLLTEDERARLMAWNATKTDYSQELCVHQLFEQQAEQSSEAVALILEDEMLTYTELNRRANQLAHHLRKLGVGPEVVVGICMERSIEMVVGLLGVLKAGGAYVPLDPGHPQERLAWMLQDSQVFMLLVQQQSLKKLPAYNGPVFCLDSDWQRIAHTQMHSKTLLAERALRAHLNARKYQEQQQNLVSGTQLDNLAYVIYTSGSTGKPKGVMISHRAIGNRLLWGQSAARLGMSDRILHVASFSFDISLWEIFGPLLAGACLVLARPEGYQDYAYLLMLLEQQQITVAHFVPTLLQVLLEAPKLAACRSLRCVLYGGEASSADLPRRFFARSEAQLQQFYGPTEAAINATSWICNPQTPARFAGIGRPITNMQAYLLDRQGQPVPIGIAGEIYLGGVGLARGYFNRPDLSAERFVPHSFSDEPGALLYRTGDLARYLPDGNIEFLGRIDQQVKIRGYRIELGEVEATLRAHPAIQDGVVLAREDVPGEKRLVAYLVVQQGETLSGSDLRSFLQDRLPSYMIPSAFVFLGALPQTPNGKVDRRALPVPEGALDVERGAPEEARTPIEELLVGIWSEVLRRRQVGIHENFFALGGHSLLATQIIARVEAVIQVAVPVRNLFETPTIAGLAAFIEHALRTQQGVETPPIRPVSCLHDLPLSFAQQRLWFLDQLEPQSVAYLIPMALRLHGPLDPLALERSLGEMTARHEILRTSFLSNDGQPVQVIAPIRAPRLPRIDLRAFSQTEREKEARRLAEQEVQQPFDLAHGPLLRTCLLQLDEQEHILLLTMHHIISDGWSSTILQRELGALYQAFVARLPSPLEPLPIQYADYALWQRLWLRGEVLEAQLDYWKGQLAGLTPLELPSDHPRPPIPSGRGASQKLLVPPQLQQELMALSQREGVTLFMTLLAAFQVLLARYSGQQDISVGTPIANRTRAEVERLIGFFVNTLVLRSDLSGQPSFVELLGRVRQAALGAYAHQDVPFEMLVEQLEPERDLSRSPLFQVMFSLQHAVEMTETLEGIVLSSLEVESSTTKFDLILTVTSRAQGLSCHLDYNTDLFEASTIQRLLEHWQVLLQGIVADPQQTISTLPLLSPAEEQTLLLSWNATAEERTEKLLHQLIETQAQATPDSVAVIFEEMQLTYQVLNIRANQLAHTLQRQGVGPDMLVGVCLERSPELVIALLGILKAGGAYVPLDPSYPPKRLAYMLADAGVPLVLTQVHLRSRLVPNAVQALSLDDNEFWSRRKGQNTDNPQVQVQTGHLAYLIYTSGSTGQPKGVMISHGGLSHYVQWSRQFYEVVPGSCSIVHTSLTFDLTITSLFLALVSGGSVLLAREEPGIEGLLAALGQVPEQHLLKITPAHLDLLRSACSSQDRAWEARALVIGGEALWAEQLDYWRQHAPATRLINEYGPTETVVGCCVYEVRASDAHTGAVPIGRPIANTQIYLLDGAGQLVPRGVLGEICIGGSGLARGYFKRAEQTAERFVPHPFSGEPGARLYRTGDLGRYGEDGQLEYVGRRDEQVKVRGYRVELGEIEAVLREHEEVAETVVVLWQGEAEGAGQLVAYVVGRASGEAGVQSTSQQLKQYMRERLPEYMVPAVVQWLDALPLTAHGKVDRRVLPAPESFAGETDGVLVEPRNPIEETLAEIWSQVLARPPRGIHEHFFEAGGHSLLATRFIARVRELLQVEVPLRSLFEAPTIAGLAAVIEQEQTALVDQAESEELAQMLRAVEELSEEEARMVFDSEL